MDEYVIATAEINGEIKEIYRDGHKEEFYIPKHYSSQQIESLFKELDKWNTKLKKSFDLNRYIFSDDYSFLSCKIPELVKCLFELQFGEDVGYYSENGHSVYYTGLKHPDSVKTAFNEHFFV